MLPELPFTTVWIEFHTVEQALAFYLTTDYPSRLSPECDRSVDIAFHDRVIPTGQLKLIPGVAERPQMFVLDAEDEIPFLDLAQRDLAVAA